MSGNEEEVQTKGVFGRIYARQAKRGGVDRNGPNPDREGGRRRDQGRQASRRGKESGEASEDAEQRMRVDTKAHDLHERVEALPGLLSDIDILLRDAFNRPADGMREAARSLGEKLGELVELSLEEDALTKLAELEGELEELEEAIGIVSTQLSSQRLIAALEWSETREAEQLFLELAQEREALTEALCGGYPVDVPEAARFCDTVEAAKTEVDAASSDIVDLRQERDDGLKAPLATLKWFSTETEIDLGERPVCVVLRDLQSATLTEVTPENFPASARAKLRRDIAALANWSAVIEGGIRQDKYIRDLLRIRDNFWIVLNDAAKPPFDSPPAMLQALADEVLALPPDAGGIDQELVKAKLCPGRWAHFIRNDAVFADQQQKANARQAAIALLSTHLQTGPNWGLAKAAADDLAKQMYAANSKALEKLQSSALTQATWDQLAVYVGFQFDTFADIFKAIDQLNTQAALAALATERLPRCERTAVNLTYILANNIAVLANRRGYPYEPPNTPKTLGASVEVKWVGWMPGGAKSDGWGAVHFHFDGVDVNSNVTVIHLKDYETHMVSDGSKVTIWRPGWALGAGATAALNNVVGGNFSV